MDLEKLKALRDECAQPPKSGVQDVYVVNAAFYAFAVVARDAMPELVAEVNESRMVRAEQAAKLRRHLDELRDAGFRVERSESESARLRNIISECSEAIGNGSCCSSDASVTFMQMLPAEIRAEVERLRAELAALKAGQ